LAPETVSVPAYSTELIDATFNSAGLALGTYTADITVSNSAKTAIIVPATLNVISLEPPTDLTADLDIPTGQVDLNWNYNAGGIDEDFEDGVADNWLPVTGTWSVAGGTYNVVSGSLVENSSYYNEDFTNYDFEVSMRKTVGSSYDAGVFFSGDPSSYNTWGYWDNAYNLEYNLGGDWYIVKWEAGGFTWIQGWTNSPDLNTGLGVWNDLRVVFADGNMDIYFNGILQGSYFDNTFLSGKVGVCMYETVGEAEFDNITLTELAKGYTFGEVNQSKYRDVYGPDSSPVSPGVSIGQVLSPIPPYEGQYTYEGDSKAFLNFIVYRDGAEIGTTANTYYTDYLPAFGTYEYEVTAFYDEGESPAAGPVEVIWEQGFTVTPDFFTEDLYPYETSTQLMTINNLTDDNMDFYLDIVYGAKSTMSIQEVEQSIIERSGILDGSFERTFYSIIENKDVTVTYTKSEEIVHTKYSESKSDIAIGILGADYDHYCVDVQDKLLNTGKFISATIIDVKSVTPTLGELQAFDAVIVWSDYGFQNSTLLGDNLADYVDAGGGVVNGMWDVTNYSTDLVLQGRWLAQEYYVFNKDGYSGVGPQYLGAILDPSHPTVAGINTYDGGGNSFRPITTSLVSGASLIAEYTDGIPLVVVKDIGGTNRAELGMWPVSSDVHGGGWNVGSDGALLMANALEWVAGGSGYGWLSVDPENLAIPAFSSDDVDVGFDASGLAPGIYTADIIVSNVAKTEIVVPVTLTVLQPVYGEIKAFLEGPFNSGMMNTYLNTNGFIPLSQPYAGAPWNYAVTDEVVSIPNGDVTDWVLVELRETTGDASTSPSKFISPK